MKHQLWTPALLVTLVAIGCGSALVLAGRETAGVGLITWALGGWTAPRPPGGPQGPQALPPVATAAVLALLLST